MPKSTYTHNYNKEPRLSASQVSEYVYVNSTNRRRILRDAKFPPIGPIIQYNAARDALRSYLPATAANRDLRPALDSMAQRLETSEISDFEKKCILLNMEALDGFETSETKDLRNIRFSRLGRKLPKLNLNDVSISVDIDLRTKKIDKSGIVKTGGLVLFFSKKRDLHTDDRCKSLSLLSFEVLKEDEESETLDPTMCMVLDVFRGELHRAKSEQRNLFRTVRNSCEEVRDRWPSIEPPANYNGPLIE